MTVRKKLKEREKLLKILASIFILMCLLVFLYWFFYGSRYISTDNAYTSVESAQITPEISGTIKEVLVTDTDKVSKGQILVLIDDRDLQLALTQAVAEEKKAEAVVKSAKSDLDKATIEFNRRRGLVKTGAVSGDEMTATENTLIGAKSARIMAEEALIQAQSKVAQIQLDLSRTIIKSPEDGVVAKRQVQVGQRVPAGAPLMIVVPVEQMHVDANFKENEVKKIKIGQAATLTSDLYGSSVVYHGTVSGIAGGTGSAFSAIPAQNATGNWIKVVQRLPVRIELDSKELQSNPLSVGLSMDVEVDLESK